MRFKVSPVGYDFICKETLHQYECQFASQALTEFFEIDQSVLCEHALFDIGQSILFQNRHFPKT